MIDHHRSWLSDSALDSLALQSFRQSPPAFLLVSAQRPAKRKTSR